MFKRVYRWVPAIAAVVLIIAMVPGHSRLAAVAEGIRADKVLLIDPGHGGLDGGAVNELGISEKDINLSISKKIKELAEKEKWKVIMTRDNDSGLYDEDDGSIRNKKCLDLRRRRDVIRESSSDAVVSIHLNSFKEDRSVHGAQVFYPGTESDRLISQENKKLADAIGSGISEKVNDGTKRETLCKNDVYICKNIRSPMAIVECGFLSNSREADLLQTDKYQQKMAEGIFEGIKKYLMND